MAYELLLSRLLAITSWHHFGFMIVSIAVFGGMLGAIFVALFRGGLGRRFARSYLTLLTLFGASALSCFLFAQLIPFSIEEVLWDINQPLYLMAACAILAVPFFFASAAITLCLGEFRDECGRVYGFAMIGAGAGALALIGLLYVFMPDTTLRLVSVLGLLCAAAAWVELRAEPRSGAAVFALLASGLLLLPAEWTALTIAPQKSLARALLVGGANLAAERSSPLGLLSVVENTLVPWQYAPGLSLNAKHEPPEQIGVYVDADALTIITRPAPQAAEMDYLDDLTSALPYHLRAVQRALIVNAGGGADVLQARMHNVPLIDATETNPQLTRLVRDDYGTFSGGLYDASDVTVHNVDARAYLAGTDARYDLIQISQSDPIATTTAGRFALSENYLYTVESMREFLAHLEPGGMLAFTRWINLPPRDVLKLYATVNAALERNGILDGATQMILIRSWQTATLVVRNSPFLPEDIAKIQTFCKQRGFDVGYYAGMQEDETNRYNVTDRAYFYLGASAISGDRREAYLSRYKFNLRPATDDQPYFYDFFRWQTLSDMLSLRDKGGVVVLEWSYLVAFSTLAVLGLLVMLCAVIPLLLSSQLLRMTPHNVRIGRIFVHCLALGMATTALTMVAMQKFTLSLHHPLVATAIVLGGLLIFGGAGSLFAQRFADTRQHRAALWWAVLGLASMAVLVVGAVEPLFITLADLPISIRLLAALALVAPLGFCMGMPAALTFDHVGADATVLLPWAYGLHLGAAVLGAPVVLLIAMHLGQIAAALAALALLALAALMFPAPGESF